MVCQGSSWERNWRRSTGMMQDSVISVIIPNGEATPFGPGPPRTGSVLSGFLRVDSTNWILCGLTFRWGSAQKILGVPDVVNSLEVKLNDIYRAPQSRREIERIVPNTLAATDWMEQNKPILNALRMERMVTLITISLIQMIAALNILIALVMAVMEKSKDIAILLEHGSAASADPEHICASGRAHRRGRVGDRADARLHPVVLRGPLSVDSSRGAGILDLVFALQAAAFDAIWIAGIAIAISFLATLYPARNATRIVPVEDLAVRVTSMCGIAGYTHLNRPADPIRMREAAACIHHRGPDQSGTYDSHTVSLAAVRPEDHRS